jgi:Actin
MGNVVLAGGGSLFAGLGERLNNELVRNFPHIKIHAPGNPAERRYGSWLGGSILASLGTFHQLWISREEWQVSFAMFPRRSALTFFSRNMANLLLLSDVNNLFQLSVHLIPSVSCRTRQCSCLSLTVSEQRASNTFLSHFPLTYVIYMPRTRHKGPGTKIAAAEIASNHDNGSEI